MVVVVKPVKAFFVPGKATVDVASCFILSIFVLPVCHKMWMLPDVNWASCGFSVGLAFFSRKRLNQLIKRIVGVKVVVGSWIIILFTSTSITTVDRSGHCRWYISCHYCCPNRNRRFWPRQLQSYITYFEAVPQNELQLSLAEHVKYLMALSKKRQPLVMNC